MQTATKEPLEFNERVHLEVEHVPTTHFVGLAVSYLFGVFFLFLVGTASMAAVIFNVAGAAMCFATLGLCSMWADLGPGAYWKRALGSLAVGLFVATGPFLALLFSRSVPDSSIGAGVFLSVGPIVWLLTQIPFFIVRSVLRWRLAPKPSFGQLTIPDIFGFLTVAAVCFACLQFAQWIPEPEGPQSNMSILGGVIATCCILSILLQLFVSFPCLSAIFGSESSGDGFARVFGVGICLVFGLFFLLILLGGAFGAGRQTPVLAFILVVFVGSYAGAFSLPLMFHREAGIQLWNRTRTDAWLALHPSDDQSDATAAHQRSELDQATEELTVPAQQ